MDKAATARKTYQIERVSTAEGIGALCEPWTELVDQIPDLRIFLTWEWVSTWSRHLEPGWELWVLTARDENGRLAGIAPWTLSHHRYGPLHVKRLAFMGSSYAYRTHQDIIARPEERGAVFDAFMTYLNTRRGEWDVLDLEALSEGSPVKDHAARAGGLYREKEPIVCPYTELRPTWETFELDKLSANRRQQLRARRRKIERDFEGVRFQRVRDRSELPAAMDALVELHRKRWHGRGQKSSFDIASFQAFHRDIAEVALSRDWLRLFILWIGDQPIAAEYCFLYRGVLFDYQKGFDPDPKWERYSPGQLIQAFAIQEAIKDGAHEFDMARGTYEYKFSWTDSERIDAHVMLSGALPGHAWVAGGALFSWVKARSAKLLSPELRQKINRRLSGGKAPQPAEPADAA